MVAVRFRGMRLWTLAAALACLVALAGCGGGGSGSSSGGGGGSTPESASAIPASAPAFISANTDLGSSQWKQALELARRFPGFPQVLAQGRKELAKESVDFEQDVKPALGKELALAWLDFLSADDFVAALKPDDKGKLDALIQKAKGTKPARGEVGDYVVLGKKQSAVASATSAKSRLADDATFQAAVGALPDDALAKAYVNGAAVQAALTRRLGTSGSASSLTKCAPSLTQNEKLDWLSAALTAESGGVKLDGAAKVEPVPQQLTSYSAELPKSFPEGAYAYISFAHLDSVLNPALAAVLKCQPSVRTQLSQVEAIAGFSIKNDVIPLFKNEGAVAVYPSTQPVPTIVLALKVDDTSKALRILDRVGALLQVSGRGSVQSVTIGGVSNAKQLKVGSFSVYYGTVGGTLAISNRTDGLSGIGASGPKLADDSQFKAAVDGAGMPDKTSGFFYLDLKAGLSAIFGLAQRFGVVVPAEVRANTAPLQSALFYGTLDGDIARLAGFVGIQ